MPDRTPIRVLIVDDEPLARQRVADMVRHEVGAEIVGEADSGPAAVESIRRLRPDVVFLDVQMPGTTGLDVVREVGADSMPITIFVTAYDQHALTAFDLAAVDYLVKPFDDERFEQAFRRARRQFELSEVDRLRGRLLAVLQGTNGAESTALAPAPSRATPSPGGYLERFAVESRGKVRVIPAAEVDYIVQSGPYAELYVGDRRWLIREPMHVLEERLDPRTFLRIHRSAIVRLALVDALLRGAGGDYEVLLRTGAKLRVSRSRRETVEKALGITS